MNLQSKHGLGILGEEDKPVSILSKSGHNSCAETWNHIRSKNQEVSCWKLVWFPRHIPKHTFIGWLAIQNRLATKDKFLWGLNVDPQCALRRSRREDEDHLFFQCPFSNWCLVRHPKFHWNEVISWGEAVVCQLALWSSIYHIWQLCNAVIHQGRINSEEVILKMIKYEVNCRLESQKGFCNSVINRAICCFWGVSHSVLRDTPLGGSPVCFSVSY